MARIPADRMRDDSLRRPVTLRGKWVQLVPLDASQADALYEAGRDPEVGRYVLEGPGPERASMDRLIERLLRRQEEGTDLPFATVRVADGRPIGMTRYLHIDRPNEQVEVGGTWLDRRCWRTPYNTEAKFLLFRHAFEVEGVHRVYLKTDLRNERSQRAIERIGALREAVLREHLLLTSGEYRSSVFYSILAAEWPRVKPGLEQKLSRPWSAPSLAEIPPDGSPPLGRSPQT